MNAESEQKTAGSQGNDESDDTRRCGSINKRYIVSKGFYLAFFSAQGSLLPYLSLYFKQLRLPATQVGLITGLKPYIAFFFIPFWGCVADRFKKAKSLFVVSMLALMAGMAAYALVPVRICDLTKAKASTRFAPRLVPMNATRYDSVSNDAEQSTEDTPWAHPDIIALQGNSEHSTNWDRPVFLYLLIATILGTILSCPCLTLADTATVNLLKENNETHKYGKQRLWGSIGYGSMAFLVGSAVSRIHLCSPGNSAKKDVNYYPCFVVFVLFNLVALVVGTRLEFDKRKETPSSDQDEETKAATREKTGIAAGLSLLVTPRFAMFLGTAFFVGITMGFIRVFLFWHLKDLGGTQMLFSTMTAINCVAEVTVYFLSSQLIASLGTVRVLYLGLACYALRLFYYAFVSSPWTVLPVELLSGITTAAVWAAMMSYVGTHTVEGAAVTLQGETRGLFPRPVTLASFFKSRKLPKFPGDVDSRTGPNIIGVVHDSGVSCYTKH